MSQNWVVTIRKWKVQKSCVGTKKRQARYWKENFDWRKAEAQLNELPNFKTSIEVEGFGDVEIQCEPCLALAVAFEHVNADFMGNLVVHQV